MRNDKLIWALGGESHAAPEDTIPAYWGAIGAGADGLVIGVQLTADNELVCCSNLSLDKTCGDSRAVGKLELSEIQKLDAGSQFRSVILDDDHQATDISDDTPWVRHTPNDSLYHPTLSHALLRLSRRTRVILRLVAPQKASRKQIAVLVSETARALEQFGLTRSALIASESLILSEARKQLPETRMVLVDNPKLNVSRVATEAVSYTHLTLPTKA